MRIQAAPRLLYICQENPWRLNSGGLIRDYWLVRSLAEHFRVDLVTADDQHNPLPGDFRAFCSSIACFPRRRGWRSRALRGLEALKSDGTFFTSGSVTSAMKAGVAWMIREHSYAAVMLAAIMRDALPPVRPAIVYNSQNCESELLRRRAALAPLPARIAIEYDARRLRRIERRLIEQSALVLACSAKDVEDLGMLSPALAQKVAVVPNGVDTQKYASIVDMPTDPRTVLITGSFDWTPNRDGLRWFLRAVLPRLTAMTDDVSIRVAGRMSPKVASELQSIAHVDPVPNPPDMRAELARATVVAVPVLASSGTRLRILEAWAAGRPVVTTPEGALGLECRDGAELLIRALPNDFALGLVELLSRPQRRESIRAAGLEAARLKYDWQGIGPVLLSALERALSP